MQIYSSFLVCYLHVLHSDAGRSSGGGVSVGRGVEGGRGAGIKSLYGT